MDRSEEFFHLCERVRDLCTVVRQVADGAWPDALVDWYGRPYMRVIYHRAPLSLSQIAYHRHVSIQQASRVVNRLVKIGFAKVSLGGDGRERKISLTPQGRRWIGEHDQRVRRFIESEVLDWTEITDDDIRATIRVLKASVARFRSILQR